VAGSQRRSFSSYIFGCTQELYSRLLLTAALVALMTVLVGHFSPRVAQAEDLMCGWKVAPRTQTVWVAPDLTGSGVTSADVLAAFEPWNKLFVKYHGFPIFVEYRGDPSRADIVVTARGSERTWVRTPCSPGVVSQGATHTTVFLGPRDSWRNRDMLSHELGHTLGFADHGAESQHSEGHIGFQPCDNSYIGVMSYCTSRQSWFLDYQVSGITFDGGLVQRYW
jgi:hypothetical protein